MGLPDGMSVPWWHWWTTLSAVEQGTWVAGLGAIFASAVALFIASFGWRRERRAVDKRKQHLTGLYLGAYLDAFMEIGQEVLLVHQLLDPSRQAGSLVAQAGGIAALATKLRIKAVDRISVDELPELDEDIADAAMTVTRDAKGFNFLVWQGSMVVSGDNHPFVNTAGMSRAIEGVRTSLVEAFHTFAKHSPDFEALSQYVAKFSAS